MTTEREIFALFSVFVLFHFSAPFANGHFHRLTQNTRFSLSVSFSLFFSLTLCLLCVYLCLSLCLTPCLSCSPEIAPSDFCSTSIKKKKNQLIKCLHLAIDVKLGFISIKRNEMLKHNKHIHHNWISRLCKLEDFNGSRFCPICD